jgi:ubiquinone/menaquinone biosynthesis C-methylase UbiE
MQRTVTTEDLYLEGEERFGPVTSFFFGIGSIFLNRYYGVILEDLEAKKFDNLLDVGCGTGALLTRLAKKYQTKSFYGLDPSPHMLQRAKKNLIRNGLGNRVELKNGSSRIIPFDVRFDAIVSSFSYHHWIERDESLKSLLPHLNEHGTVSIYEFDNSNRAVNSSHGVEEREWNSLEIEGIQKSITHRKGIIVLTLSK